MKVGDLEFLNELSEFIRRNLATFEEGGRVLDKRFSTNALRAISKRRADDVEAEYQRLLQSMSSEGRLPASDEELIENQHRLSGGSFSKEEPRASKLQASKEHAERTRERADREVKTLSWARVRLGRDVIPWCTGHHDFYGRASEVPELKALCIVAWLHFDRDAHNVRPLICEFHGMPWRLTGKFAGAPFQGRGWLVDGEEDVPQGLIESARRAFTMVKLSLVGARQVGAETIPPEDDSPPSTPDPSPLSPKESAVLDIILKRDPNKPITSEAISKELADRNKRLFTDASGIRSRIIPRLKRSDYGLKSHGRRGYSFPSDAPARKAGGKGADEVRTAGGT